MNMNYSFGSNLFPFPPLEETIFRIAEETSIPINLVPLLLPSQKRPGLAPYIATEKLLENETELMLFTCRNPGLIRGVTDDFRLFEARIDSHYPQGYVDSSGRLQTRHNSLEAEMERITRTITFLNFCGGRSLTVWLGAYGERGLIPEHEREQRILRAAESLFHVLRWMRNENIHGVQILIEPSLAYERQTLHKIEEALVLFNHVLRLGAEMGLEPSWIRENLGLAYDLFQGSHHEDDPTHVKAIRRAGDWLKAVHVSGSFRRPLTYDYFLSFHRVLDREERVQDLRKVIRTLHATGFFERGGDLVFEWATWNDLLQWSDFDNLLWTLNESRNIVEAILQEETSGRLASV